jgi:hypothetical protein
MPFDREQFKKNWQRREAEAAAKMEGHRERGVNTTPSWRDNMITARELCTMTFKPLKFIVPGILPEGLTILAGRPKIGKSWLTLLVGIAVANGVEALGQDYGLTKPTNGEVLYLALEDGPRRLQRRMTKILGSARPENWPARLHLQTSWRRFYQGGIEDIRAWYADEKAKGNTPILIIIDTLARVRPPASPKQSPYQNDHDALAGLQKLSEELGLAIVVTHHDRKMAADDVFDTLSGTLGLTGAVDTILVLTKKGQERTLHVRGRDIEEEAALAMNFNVADCRWSVAGTDAQRQEKAQSEGRRRVLEALQAAPEGEGLPVSDIAVVAGLPTRNATDALLFRMVQDGEVRRTRRGFYGLSDDERKKRKIVRIRNEVPETKEENANLTHLTQGMEIERNSDAEVRERIAGRGVMIDGKTIYGEAAIQAAESLGDIGPAEIPSRPPPADPYDPGDIPPSLDRRPKPNLGQAALGPGGDDDDLGWLDPGGRR